MAHVLPVAAFEVGDPIAVFVLVESDNALSHGVFSPSPLTGESRVYGPETWWTGVRGHGGHIVSYSVGCCKSSSLTYW